ncbi:MAG: DUF2497 domain-containing protein [Defluviicoccus sp.]
MTDDPQKSKASQQEPSMEDILASIRRILAEDTGGTAAKEEVARDAQKGFAPEPVEPPAPVQPEPVADEPTEPEQIFEIEEPHAEPAEALFEEDEVPSQEPIEDDDDLVDEEDQEEEVFELTPNMKAKPDRALISNNIVDSSTDVLSQLARAILDRRDIAVGARDVTLESMVRTMLRPLLKEWLDRNLPYLIERLVKKEIDLMVNRAERLD